MIESFSEHLADKLCKAENTKCKDKQIYSYGVYLLVFWAITFLMTIIVGVIFGAIKEALLFYVFFMPLRKMAGGLHVSSPIMCFILSVTIISGAIIVGRNIELGWYGFYISLILYLLCYQYIPSLGKKSFSQKERVTMRRRVTVIMLVDEALILVFLLTDHLQEGSVSMIAVLSAEILVILNEFVKKMHVREHFLKKTGNSREL